MKFRTLLTGSSVANTGYHYTYDPAGNIASKQVETTGTSATMTTFTHNTLNQITDLGGTAGVKPVIVRGNTNEPATVKVKPGIATASKDARMLAGNRFEANLDLTTGQNLLNIQAKDGSNNVSNYTYGLTLAATTAASPTYDADGNMTRDGVRSYDWDYLSRLYKIHWGAGSGKTTEYRYNALGQRSEEIEKTDTTETAHFYYVYEGVYLLCRYNGETTAAHLDRQYLAQGELRILTIDDQPSTLNYYYNRDHLGSIREVMNSDGTLAARYDYAPNGKRIIQYESTDYSGGCDLGYTGHLTQQSPVTGQGELLLTHFRGYAPDLGRWLSTDPIGEEGGVNLYGYVEGNPLNLVDPLGLICVGDKFSKDQLHQIEETVVGRQLTQAVRTAESSSGRQILIRHDATGISSFIFNDITLGKIGDYQDPAGNWHPFTADQILVHELQHALDSLNKQLEDYHNNKTCPAGFPNVSEQRAVDRENQYLDQRERPLRKDYISTKNL